MALGRSRRLDRVLLRNFPRMASGELDWSVFENGPPDYLVAFMRRLDQLATKTLPKLLRAQVELGMPAWEDVPKCEPDPEHKGRYLFDPKGWGLAASGAMSPLRRVAGKRAAANLSSASGGIRGACLDSTPAGGQALAKRARQGACPDVLSASEASGEQGSHAIPGESKDAARPHQNPQGAVPLPATTASSPRRIQSYQLQRHRRCLPAGLAERSRDRCGI